MKILLDLFFTFFKIGLFTFGGGYAMLSVIEHACVEKKKWLTHEEMMDVTVIGESTPGPISINCASYVGYQQAGFLGSLMATLGVIVPSFVIIYAISKFLNNFLEITVVANAFRGIKIAVGLLIVNVGFNMLQKMQKKPLSVGILVCACAVMLCINIFAWNFSSVVLMLLMGALSIGVCAVKNIRQKGGAEG